MKTLLLIAAVVAALSAGCVRVPTSEIRFGDSVAKLPKDSSADELKLRIRSGTNEMTFEATNWTTKNNPHVITASGEQIKAHYAGAAGVVETAIKASGKAVVPVP